MQNAAVPAGSRAALLPGQASALVPQEEGLGVLPLGRGHQSHSSLRHSPFPQKRRSCSAPPAQPAPAPRGQLALQTFLFPSCWKLDSRETPAQQLTASPAVT